VAIAGIGSKQLLEIDRRCKALNVTLRVIPTTSEIIGGAIKLGDISDVTEEDLLGRRQIHTDEAGILEMLKGKRILITGAGGSIGSELARQVHRYQPEFVGILDRDESAIHATQLSIDGQGLLDSDTLILADIRDRDWIRKIMKSIKPDIVFHAAALKHLPLLERYPDEGHKTNVIGTQNILEAAQECNVHVFINISTDKAADPSCVLGRTKLMTEQMTASVQSSNGDRYLSVRFGNVLGSRGSVLTAFRHQIANGGPVTVTDPEVTRYFMTIPEAVHLVLQAAVIGEHTETLILDMGEPIKIDDVAKHMIEKSGRDISIVYTGLRPGEKSAEVLFATTEVAVTKSHPLIFHTTVNMPNLDRQQGVKGGQQ
jgi:dTDP-glucose 4,6-dehydratase